MNKWWNYLKTEVPVSTDLFELVTQNFSASSLKSGSILNKGWNLSYTEYLNQQNNLPNKILKANSYDSWIASNLNIYFTMRNTILRWPITVTAIAKRNTVNKENLTKKFCSRIKKVCFHINKICSHVEKQICLHVQPANTHGKFLRQILAANSHGKFLRQILTANSCVK